MLYHLASFQCLRYVGPSELYEDNCTSLAWVVRVFDVHLPIHGERHAIADVPFSRMRCPEFPISYLEPYLLQSRRDPIFLSTLLLGQSIARIATKRGLYLPDRLIA